MPTLERVTLHTVRSTWSGQIKNPLANPYRRILGIESGDEQLWSRVGPLDHDMRDLKRQAVTEELEVPDNFKQRLISFFERFLADRARTERRYETNNGLNSPNPVTGYGYNCHRFAFWMRGVGEVQDIVVPGPLEHIIEEGIVVENPLALGQHAVVGVRVAMTGKGYADHSLIGLGEDTNDCLQVSGARGYMGIDTYARTLENYSAPYLPSKIFTLPVAP